MLCWEQHPRMDQVGVGDGVDADSSGQPSRGRTLPSTNTCGLTNGASLQKSKLVQEEEESADEQEVGDDALTKSVEDTTMDDSSAQALKNFILFKGFANSSSTKSLWYYATSQICAL